MIEILLNENGCIFSCDTYELNYMSDIINKVYSRIKKRNYDIVTLSISDQEDSIKNRVKEIIKNESFYRTSEIHSRPYDYLRLRQYRYSFLISQGINIDKDTRRRRFASESVHVDINGCLDMIVGFIRIRHPEDDDLSDQIFNPEETICIANANGLHIQNYTTDKEHLMMYKQLEESFKLFGFKEYLNHITNKKFYEAHFDDIYNCKLIRVDTDVLVELPIGSLSKKFEPNSFELKNLKNLRNESLRHLLFKFGISVDRRGWKKDFFDKNLYEVDWSDVRFTQLFIERTISEQL